MKVLEKLSLLIDLEDAENALASGKFGNYYSAKRMGASNVPLGLTKGTIFAKGKIGDRTMQFRTIQTTGTGKRVLLFRPFKLVKTIGKKYGATRKMRELAPTSKVSPRQ